VREWGKREERRQTQTQTQTDPHREVDGTAQTQTKMDSEWERCENPGQINLAWRLLFLQRLEEQTLYVSSAPPLFLGVGSEATRGCVTGVNVPSAGSYPAASWIFVFTSSGCYSNTPSLHAMVIGNPAGVFPLVRKYFTKW